MLFPIIKLIFKKVICVFYNVLIARLMIAGLDIFLLRMAVRTGAGDGSLVLLLVELFSSCSRRSCNGIL